MVALERFYCIISGQCTVGKVHYKNVNCPLFDMLGPIILESDSPFFAPWVTSAHQSWKKSEALHCWKSHIAAHIFPILYFRLSRYQQFKDFQKRILVATNLFGRGMDIERVNIVFNYDMPDDSDTYLHRVSIGLSRWTTVLIVQLLTL